VLQDGDAIAELSLEFAVSESTDYVLDRLDDVKHEAVVKYSEVHVHTPLRAALPLAHSSVSSRLLCCVVSPFLPWQRFSER
jgi:hypothetical protein